MTNEEKKKSKIIAILTAAVILTAAALYCAYATGALLPSWIKWETKKTEGLLLECRRVTYDDGMGAGYVSPYEWLVQDALLCDIDSDGETELLLLAWRRGSFGPHRPFWEEKNDSAWSQHVFILSTGDTVRQKWMSSALGFPVLTMRYDGQNGLLALTPPSGERDTSFWRWEGFGLKGVPDREVKFIACGDLMAHEEILHEAMRQGGSFDHLFDDIREEAAIADIASIQQECVLVDDPGSVSGYPRFGAPLALGEAIVKAGFNVVTCASNHAADKGLYGINATKMFYEGHEDVLCLGLEGDASHYESLSVNGVSLALFDLTYGLNNMKEGVSGPGESVHVLPVEGSPEEARLLRALDTAGTESDAVIIYVHWGTEYSKKTDDCQRRWAKLFHAHGADVIIGTHPHVVQPYEVLKDDAGHETHVFFSIGNFASSNPDPEENGGVILRFRIVKRADGSTFLRVDCH